MGKYEGNDNYGKPRSKYVELIADMDRATLLEEAENKIWLPAFAANNPRSDYHWHVNAIYDECVKRDDTGIYEEAYKKASAQ
jgi:hypothetical protein